MGDLPGSDKSVERTSVLGRLLQEGNLFDDSADLHSKMAKAYHIYKPLLRTTSNEKRRLQIIQACILQTVLWLSETWAPTPTRQRRSELRGFHLAVLRAVFRWKKDDAQQDEHRHLRIPELCARR